MKKEFLTVKELAVELRMSPKSIQRAYRKEEIPPAVVGSHCAVQSCKSPTGDGTEWTTPHASSQRQLVTAGRDRRTGPAARTAETPPSGNTGALPTGIVTGGLRIP